MSLTPWFKSSTPPTRSGWYEFDQGDGKVSRAFYSGYYGWCASEEAQGMGFDDRLYVGTKSLWRGCTAPPNDTFVYEGWGSGGAGSMGTVEVTAGETLTVIVGQHKKDASP